MIYIDRNSVLIPEIFHSKQVEIAKKRLEEFYQSLETSRNQKRFSRPFDAIILKEIKDSLKNLFKNKCAYELLPANKKEPLSFTIGPSANNLLDMMPIPPLI